jgi:organic radical activating enzyme
VETSGAYALTGTWDWITLSPKKFKAARSDVFEKADELKVIVFHKSDLQWAEEQATLMNKKNQLFLQAEWEKKELMNSLIIDYITGNPKWKISVQIHKYLGVS